MRPVLSRLPLRVRTQTGDPGCGATPAWTPAENCGDDRKSACEADKKEIRMTKCKFRWSDNYEYA